MRFTYPDGFERFWKLHPKGGKRYAYKCWAKLTDGGSDEKVTAWLHDKLAQYAEVAKDAEFTFLPDLSKWLNQGYFDTPIASFRKQHQKADPHKQANDAMEELWRRDQAKLAREREYDRQAMMERAK